ncbi:MAG: ABC transporter permease [Planctomycetota bacterium]|nr:ABC transporter permease [Planctomycetota bacterium]
MPQATAPVTRKLPGARSARITGWVGAIVVGVMFLTCLATLPYTLAPVPAGALPESDEPARALPRRFEATNLDQALLPPFWAHHAPDERARLDAAAEATGRAPHHLFGTDRLGRDLFVRCLAGGGISLGIGLTAALVAVFIGTTYGTVSGYMGGRIDAGLMRLVDIFYGLPNVLLVVLLAVAVDGLVARAGVDLAPAARQVINVLTLLIAIGSVTWLTMARVIRGQVLSLKQQPFIEACRATGVPLKRQFFVHLLPNLLGPIIVYATLTVPAAILSESFLSFLGIGVKEPLPSWGNLAAAGLNELNIVRSRWWLLFWPCLFIALALLALNFVGEALREAFDPKRRPARA